MHRQRTEATATAGKPQAGQSGRGQKTRLASMRRLEMQRRQCHPQLVESPAERSSPRLLTACPCVPRRYSPACLCGASWPKCSACSVQRSRPNASANLASCRCCIGSLSLLQLRLPALQGAAGRRGLARSLQTCACRRIGAAAAAARLLEAIKAAWTVRCGVYNVAEILCLAHSAAEQDGCGAAAAALCHGLSMAKLRRRRRRRAGIPADAGGEHHRGRKADQQARSCRLTGAGASMHEAARAGQLSVSVELPQPAPEAWSASPMSVRRIGESSS